MPKILALLRTAAGAVLVVLCASVAPARATVAADDAAALEGVEDYLNSIETLQARFVQIGPQGQISEGDLYLRRPGRLRFEYEPPVPILIVADGTWLVLYDKELEQVQRYPVYETPLGVLVARKVDLNDPNIRITDVVRDAG